ncbi:HAD-IA family hydrolase [Fibrivirga algicola]|uniref:HAD-IA family hydrolase n=1 Tax=Fibrivirga algicola TaxID=2950420 RepID=A0ABX0QLZ5_9BACT|nr:HAD-IA family hydrolase [Fibrivirga algicola]NID13479.1 HAD-IA family hydrolase [Fibrivirga algicola]
MTEQTGNKRLTTLFIDIGGVLLSNGWGHEARQRAAIRFKLDLPELEKRHLLTFATYELGKLTLTDYLGFLVFYEKKAFSMADFRAFMFAQSTPMPAMIALIRQLKQTYQLKIVVVSNEGRELNRHRTQTFALNGFVDCFISSSFVQLRKPDADIYRLALDIAQVSVNEVLYLDDQPLFIDVARKLGIQSICHLDYPTTAAELASLGFSVTHHERV